jgi:hypothetical protein
VGHQETEGQVLLPPVEILRSLAVVEVEVAVTLLAAVVVMVM